MADLHDQEPAPKPAIATIQWSNTSRYIVAVLFLFALLGLAIFVSPIARNLAAALLFAFLLDIPVRYIARRTPVSYRWSAMAVYMLLYIVMALLLITGWR